MDITIAFKFSMKMEDILLPLEAAGIVMESLLILKDWQFLAIFS